MSQGVPSGLEGQIESPNSIELLWENNKRLVTGILIAAVVFVVVKYAIQYLDRRETDTKWSEFAVTIGLDKAYTSVPENPFAGQDERFANFEFMMMRTNLVTRLGEDIQQADLDLLKRYAAKVGGDRDFEPWTLWVLAHRMAADDDFDAAIAYLKQLRASYPNHLLCTESDYPVQWRPLKEVEESGESESGKKPKKPKYVDPVAGSSVGIRLAAFEREKAFRSENPEFFKAVEPESTETATIEFSDDDPDGSFNGKVVIRFFKSRAPLHVEAFRKAVEEKFWDGQRVHRLARGRLDSMLDGSNHPSEFAFGLPITAGEDDRSKWNTPIKDVQEVHLVDWEDAPELSHFPGTVAVEAGAEGKSQIERIVINGDDVAVRQDGNRVIIGRVVEGLDFVKRLIYDAALRSESEETSGRGIPRDGIRLKSVTWSE